MLPDTKYSDHEKQNKTKTKKIPSYKKIDILEYDLYQFKNLYCLGIYVFYTKYTHIKCKIRGQEAVSYAEEI